MTTHAYEETRQRHVSDWMTAVGSVVERRSWTRAQLEDHQEAALRRVVAKASARSPWHAARLAGVNVKGLMRGDLASLPTMTKQDIVEHFDDVVTDRRITRQGAEAHLRSLTDDAYFLDELHVVASGGSSGERAVFVYGWDAWVHVHLGLGRRIVELFGQPDIPAGPITAGVVAAGNATHMTSAVAATFRSPMVDTHPFPVTLPVSDIVAGLNRVQPVVLMTYASTLGVLAHEAEAGRLRISPRRIVATSEPLLPEARASAERVFDAPVANCWGTSEGGAMAVGCWQSAGMHLNEDLVIVEPVDPDGRPVPTGEVAAKVLVTNLYNDTMPLIRYELTDEVTVLDEPCPCGEATLRVADVQGRTDDVFTYGNVAVHPHVIRSVVGRHPAIVTYQVVQTNHGIDVSFCATATLDQVQVRSELERALAEAGLPAADVHVRLVDDVERHKATGKLRRFVPQQHDPVRAPAGASPRL